MQIYFTNPNVHEELIRQAVAAGHEITTDPKARARVTDVAAPVVHGQECFVWPADPHPDLGQRFAEWLDNLKETP